MRIFFLLFSCFVVMTTKAQTSEDSVKQTIYTLFTAMRTSDAKLLQSVFADSAILQTIVLNRTNGNASIRNQAVKGFVQQVASMTAGDADERITFDVLKVDADLATVWTPYQFFYKGKFSHCGVNSFQLVRVQGVWKIQYLIDTRRKAGCKEQ